MTRDEALKGLEAIRRHLDSTASDHDCDCGKSRVERVKDDDGPGRDGPALARLSRAISKAFSEGVDFGNAAGIRDHAGRALLELGVALESFRDDIVVAGADGGGARAQFGYRIAEVLSPAVEAVLGAGRGALDEPGGDHEALARTIASSLTKSADVFAKARLEDALVETFHEHASFLGGLAGPIGDLVTRVPATLDAVVPAELVLQYASTTVALRGLAAALYVPRAGESIVEGTDQDCPPNCPYKGCTTYCKDFYETILSHTPAWWQRVVGGVGGPSGVYHLTCRWQVRQRKKVVCACYPSRWSRFWATSACNQWVFVTESTRIQTYNHVTVSLGVPSALPAPFWLWC